MSLGPRSRTLLLSARPAAVTALLALAIASSASPVAAQAVRSRHADVWPFGSGCRMHWSEDASSRTFGVDPVISTGEGSAAYSDPSTGELRIYSDGRTVWDSAGAVVTTGLAGDPSSMHSALIVPVPGTTDEVFVLTHGATASSSVTHARFRVGATVSQLGDVGTVALGSLLGREGMLVVPHANGADWWILVSGASAIFVVPITSSGIGEATALPSGLSVWTNGWHLFAASPAGDRIAMSGNSSSTAGSSAGDIALFDFDAATGTLTNRRVINESFRRPEYYDGAFSPDGTKLYFSTLTESSGRGAFYQYDLDTGVFVQLALFPDRYYGGAARLAPDGMIYVANSRTASLHLVREPALSGTAADFVVDAVDAPDGCAPQLGLPQTISPRVQVAGDANGSSCVAADTCRNGHCVDGVCCDGPCGGGSDTDCEACSVSAGASSDGECAPVPAGTTCRVAAGDCDLAETCTGASTTCPIDEYAPATTSCRASVGECDAAETCTGTEPACPPDAAEPEGTPCGGLAAGACDEQDLCTGTVGAAATCAARFAPAGTTCRAPSCAGGVETGGASCTGSTAECPAEVTNACAPHVCGADACATTCADETDCVAGHFCDDGACAPTRADGIACARDAECASLACVDGVCCDGACSGQCEACDVAGMEGTCTAVSGAPRGSRPPCAGDGTACDGVCDGASRVACSYPDASTTCGAASCSDAAHTTSDACDGAGTCAPGATVSCAPYACREGTCLTSCSAPTDCASPLECVAGACVSPPLDAGRSEDAGTSDDASVSGDAGVRDASADASLREDGGTAAAAGCGCSVPDRTPLPPFLLALLAPLLFALRLRRGRGGRRPGRGPLARGRTSP